MTDRPLTASPVRDYTPVLAAAGRCAGQPRPQAMQAVVDALWQAFASRGLSWIGFYLLDPAAAPGQELLLGPRRDKPACSPIGLHGACGRCLLSRRPLIVTDVARLGAGYIACDPRDRSEAVVPCLNDDGSAWGVLDADSFDVGAFDAGDAECMVRVLRAAGLTANWHSAAPEQTDTV